MNNQERYWQGKFSASELFQMPLREQQAMQSALLARCEDIVEKTDAWIDVRNILTHNKAGMKARDKCWQLFAMKPKNGGNAA